jgi:hypothetical protein
MGEIESGERMKGVWRAKAITKLTKAGAYQVMDFMTRYGPEIDKQRHLVTITRLGGSR